MTDAADGVVEPDGPLRVAVLVKQVPKFEVMELGPDGRLRRDGVELEMNPYCRRAVTTGVRLARESGGHCTVLTLGPEAAEDTLREAVAGGVDEGVLVTDPAFAGSDTLATARALASALRLTGPYDLVLFGKNSVDADTGQVPPEVAELLDLPFAAGVRRLALRGRALELRCEADDGFTERSVDLPAVLSCAERLCEPTKVDPDGRAAVDADRIRRITAAELGEGPWGLTGSPTRVGAVRGLAATREQVRLEGAVEEQVRRAMEILVDRRALDAGIFAEQPMLPPSPGERGAAVAVLAEPGRPGEAHGLLGAAARCASETGGHVALLAVEGQAPRPAGPLGADVVVPLRAGDQPVEEDVARAVAGWCQRASPWALLVPGTLWGREVASRVAARLGAGLVGDAVDLDVDAADNRLVCWKPAFGGAVVAAITCTTPLQLVTVRPGVLSDPTPRDAPPVRVAEAVVADPRRRVRVTSRCRDDDLDVLIDAQTLVAVGTGVAPTEYAQLSPLLDVLGAEMAATRKVTDKGWLPRSRQVGITGRSVSPRLYVAVGVGGKFNHAVGTRGAGTVLAVNRDPEAPIFEHADVGIVADWHEAVPALVEAVAAYRAATPG